MKVQSKNPCSAVPSAGKCLESLGVGDFNTNVSQAPAFLFLSIVKSTLVPKCLAVLRPTLCSASETYAYGVSRGDAPNVYLQNWLVIQALKKKQQQQTCSFRSQGQVMELSHFNTVSSDKGSYPECTKKFFVLFFFSPGNRAKVLISSLWEVGYLTTCR